VRTSDQTAHRWGRLPSIDGSWALLLCDLVGAWAGEGGGGEAESSPSRASATFSAVVVLPVPGVPVMSTFGSFLDAVSAIFAKTPRASEILRTPFFSGRARHFLHRPLSRGAKKWRFSLRELVLSGGCAQETPQFQEQIGAEGHS